ncbi:MAG: lplA2 [Bacillota bacterium]|nr:lplA2 [Bacillota bacterium]
MKYVESSSCDVYFNLALEEYIFTNFKDDTYFMLWKNDNSIVLGKHQNVFEEINIKAVEQKGIKVARRITGGGTVFHDRGNLNYSVMTNYDKNKFVNYDDFIIPVIKALNEIGVKAEKRRTSDIAIDGKKISGSAQTIKGDRALHHGTLLFDANLSMLHDLLKTTEGKIESKSVKSVRSVVTNIKEHICNSDMTIDEFQKTLLNTLYSDGIEKIKLTEKQLAEVNYLVENKYSQWDWNYGNSPIFSFEKENDISDLNISLNIKLQINKGIIGNCVITCDKLTFNDLENVIINTRYSYNEVVKKLKEVESLHSIKNINIKELADCFF